MPELRTDPLGGSRTVIADDRASRPGAFDAPDPTRQLDPATDPFHEGNEGMTPPEVWADRPDGSEADTPGWKVRAVPNLYPAFTSPADEPGRPADDALHGVRAAEGAHEVIVNSPRPVQSLAALTRLELEAAVAGWSARLAAHAGAGAACRHLFVNEGIQAGASLPHTHAQLIVLPFVPERIAREREAFTAHAARSGGANLLADVVAAEVRSGDRIVAIDDAAVLLAPWASASAWQLMLVPRDHQSRFEEAGGDCAAMLALALSALTRQFGRTPPLNLWVRTAPSGAEQWCWRIDILPRLAQPAGIELGTGVGINPVAPERAATQLRSALDAA